MAQNTDNLTRLVAAELAGEIARLAREQAAQLLAVELEKRDWRRLGAVSIEEAGTILGGLSRSTVVRLLDAGELTEFHSGGRRMVTVHSLRRRLKEL